MDTPSRPAGASGAATEAASLAMDRRRFLLLAGGATAFLALRPHLVWARRATAISSGPPLLQPWTLADDPPANAADLIPALVGAAVLAPSEWNAQPWRFESANGTLRLLADPRRSLSALDPDGRGMMVSLGAALENLLVTARAWGLQPAVHYFPVEGQRGVVADVTWTAGAPRRDRALLAVIPQRRTNRRGFDGRGIFPENRAQLLAQVPESVHLHWMDERDAVRDLADLVHDAVHAQVADAKAQAQQYEWMRIGDDARRGGDGVPLDALEIGTLSRFMARRYFNPQSWFVRFGADGLAKQAREGMRSAGAVALFTVPQKSDFSSVTAGQIFERFALKATQLGIAHQPISAPIEVDRFRTPLLRRFGAAGEEPLLLVRLGHAKRPDPTPRRSAWVVTSFRNS
jgi:nitroreductase